MRRIALWMAMLLIALTNAAVARAGVYNLDPPRKYPSDYLETNTKRPMVEVLSCVGELRKIQDDMKDPKNPDKPDSLRVAYLQQVARLEARRQDGVLDAADCVNLSGCLIRLGGEKTLPIWEGSKRLFEAEQVLEKALRELPPTNPYRCLLLANRAAVYEALAKENEAFQQSALRFQEEALQCWPTFLPGWTRQELAWYRRVELYNKALMELRRRERISSARTAGRDSMSPDDLFPLEERNPNKKVRFVGDSGKYEAGGIALKQMDRLPPDADKIVLQLLLWRPHDLRLLWLYGELLNARGEVDWAFKVLQSLKRMNVRSSELDNHYRILEAAQKPFELLFRDETLSGDNVRLQARLLWTFAPRGSLLAPGMGPALNELGGWAASTYVRQAEQSRTPPAPQRAVNPLPDWRHLTVSFLTGIIVAVLGLLQWQQWRRRAVVGQRLSANEESRQPIADGR